MLSLSVQEGTRTIKAPAALPGFSFLFHPLFFFSFFLRVAANATIGYLYGGAKWLQCQLDKVDQKLSCLIRLIATCYYFCFCLPHRFSANYLNFRSVGTLFQKGKIKVMKLLCCDVAVLFSLFQPGWNKSQWPFCFKQRLICESFSPVLYNNSYIPIFM